MTLRLTLALAACAATALSAPAGADPVGDALVQAGDSAYAAFIGAERTLDTLVTVDPDITPPSTVRTFDGNVDWITIADLGSGPVVEYRGVLNDRNLWDCAKSSGSGGSVVVTCHPVPGSGFTWNCGVMNVSAEVHSRAVDWYDHAATTVNELLRTGSHADAPNVPDPRPRVWGQAAGFVSCDSSALATAQANRDNPAVSATTTMGSVTTLVCEARRTPTAQDRPVPSYAVTCVDPVNPLAS